MDMTKWGITSDFREEKEEKGMHLEFWKIDYQFNDYLYNIILV